MQLNFQRIKTWFKTEDLGKAQHALQKLKYAFARKKDGPDVEYVRLLQTGKRDS